MFTQVCWRIGVVVVLAVVNLLPAFLIIIGIVVVLVVVNLLPASLIIIGISPYTGMSFSCPYYKCDDISESANTLASLISGIIIALWIWIAIIYGILKGPKAVLLKLLLRHRYIHDRWYQGV